MIGNNLYSNETGQGEREIENRLMIKKVLSFNLKRQYGKHISREY